MYHLIACSRKVSKKIPELKLDDEEPSLGRPGSRDSLLGRRNSQLRSRFWKQKVDWIARTESAVGMGIGDEDAETARGGFSKARMQNSGWGSLA